MTIGQLQVIVNDLHSQIESKWGICLEVGMRWTVVRGEAAWGSLLLLCVFIRLSVCFQDQDKHRILLLFFSFFFSFL